jgi:hypothetical protein
MCRHHREQARSHICPVSFASNATFSAELAGTKKEAEASLFNAERKCHAQKNASSL